MPTHSVKSRGLLPQLCLPWVKIKRRILLLLNISNSALLRTLAETKRCIPTTWCCKLWNLFLCSFELHSTRGLEKELSPQPCPVLLQGNCRALISATDTASGSGGYQGKVSQCNLVRTSSCSNKSKAMNAPCCTHPRWMVWYCLIPTDNGVKGMKRCFEIAKSCQQ